MTTLCVGILFFRGIPFEFIPDDWSKTSDYCSILGCHRPSVPTSVLFS